MEQLSRRQFVAAVTAAAACASCAMCAMGADAPAGAPSAPPAGEKVDIGALADFPKDGIYDQFARTNRILVVRHEGELYAASAVCTHKNSPLTVAGKEIVCKKHGSKFSEYGTPTKGPAKVSLPRYAITQNADKRLIVDTNQSFGEKDWSKETAFIKVA